MTHELVLTSVTQGLEPDSRGFCVVAKNQTIPAFLQKRLESLSEYQHLFAQDDEEYPLQPVVYSHVIFPGPDTSTWHTVSRTADVGVDFQWQPNHLTHHIALQETEFVPEGPAWLAALPGFHWEKWQTPSVRFAQGRPIPTLTAPPPFSRRQWIARRRRWLDPKKMNPLSYTEIGDPGTLHDTAVENEDQIAMTRQPSSPCPAWEALTGDAGWAGKLAETVQTGQEAVIIFRPGQNLLPLFVEALFLLPPFHAWRATFSTWFQPFPEHVVCQWKGVLDGTMLADQSRQNDTVLLIDLTKPLEAAPAGPYVEFARTGMDSTLPPTEIPPDSIFAQPADANPPTADEMLPAISVEISKPARRRRSGSFAALLHIQSRGRFYALYGVTLLLVLFLLTLVLDQVADFGLARWITATLNTGTSPSITNSGEEQAVSGNAAHTVTDETAAIKARHEAAEKERREAESRELQKKVDAAWAEYEERKKTDAAILRDFLPHATLPKYLSMSVPSVSEDNLVDPPATKNYPELAALYQYGAGLTLDFRPLLDIPGKKVQTVRIIPHIPATQTKNENEVEPLAGEHFLPDTTYFEWKVVAEDDIPQLFENPSFVESTSPESRSVEGRSTGKMKRIGHTNTGLETPMFRLRLTPEGLSLDWELEGMTTQHLYDTLSASLGFLRVSVEGNHDLAKIRSIPMFEPRRQKPLIISKTFSDVNQPDASKAEFASPLADQPWKALFDSPRAASVLKLKATGISPQSGGMARIKYPKTSSESNVVIVFETDVTARKINPDDANAETFEPIDVWFEGEVNADRLLWTCRYNDQLALLKEERTKNAPRIKELERELSQLAQDIFNNPSTATDSRSKRDELRKEQTALENRQKEIDDLLAKQPKAFQKVLADKELRIEYSVFLVPSSRQADNAPSDRFENKSSLLLMTTGE